MPERDEPHGRLPVDRVAHRPPEREEATSGNLEECEVSQEVGPPEPAVPSSSTATLDLSGEVARLPAGETVEIGEATMEVILSDLSRRKGSADDQEPSSDDGSKEDEPVDEIAYGLARTCVSIMVNEGMLEEALKDLLSKTPSLIFGAGKVDGPSGRTTHEKRERRLIAGYVDPELWERFEKGRKQRRVSGSGMLEMILWEYFGKPELTFERTERAAVDTEDESDSQ